jgi:hypothetical protein
MPHPSKIELAREKFMQAESKLEICFLSSTHDPKQEKKLMDALKAARDEYVDQLEMLIYCNPDDSHSLTPREQKLLSLFTVMIGPDRQLLLLTAEKLISAKR